MKTEEVGGTIQTLKAFILSTWNTILRGFHGNKKYPGHILRLFCFLHLFQGTSQFISIHVLICFCCSWSQKGALEDAFILERQICREAHADCFSRRALRIWFAAFRHNWRFVCLVGVRNHIFSLFLFFLSVWSMKDLLRLIILHAFYFVITLFNPQKGFIWMEMWLFLGELPYFNIVSSCSGFGHFTLIVSQTSHYIRDCIKNLKTAGLQCTV